MIKIDNLSFAYQDRFDVLKDVNLNIKSGEYVAFIGPNGGGKSTLLKLILGLVKTDRGRISIDSKKIGYVPQHTNFSLDIPITVFDVVLQGRISKFKIFYSDEDKQEALKAIEIVNMKDFKDRKISDLSGGQRQRVLIARALCLNPDILILDEPTSAIDIEGQKDIYKILKSLNITRIIVSHDINILLEGVDKVVFVNKTLFVHDSIDLPTIEKDNGHFCEIELMNYLKRTKDV